MKNIAHNILSIEDQIFTSSCITVTRDSFYWGPSIKIYMTAQDMTRGKIHSAYMDIGCAIINAEKGDRLPYYFFHSFKSI